jgi:hypothetical protein
MKHARHDYDRIQDPAGLIPEEEPVFLLRAQDELAPATVLRWSEMAIAAGCDMRIVVAAMRQAAEMVEWQRKHGSFVPDMPDLPGRD